MKTKRIQVSRGGALARLSTGGATSAGKLKGRSGVACPATLIIVEAGRRISMRELSRSVSRAADCFLRDRGVVA